ncbi:MAG: FHA domain-containing protein [Candidatus Eremiobacteraeota bacterium]|nr:FHA domain-containing protein [Candidatus Eremiobacteraeota bacterium]
MSFPASMRVGSLEVLAAAAAFAVFALRTGRAPAATQSSPSPAIELEVTERGRSRRVEAICPLVVGRATDADLLLMDSEVSRRHARFESEGGALFVTDLQSSNGTFLNGRRIQKREAVRAGDEVDVGTARIVLIG